MLRGYRMNFYKTRAFCYKSIQNANLLRLPLCNGVTGCVLGKTYFSRPPGDCCGGPSSSGPRRRSRVTYKPYVPVAHKDHDHKNMALGRPMSPHLTIYAPTVTSMTSIMQRITGVMTAGFALMLSGGTVFLSNGIETYVTLLQSLELSSTTTLLAKLLIGMPFSYHYFNGMRFVAWNAGKLLSKKQVYATATYAMIGCAFMTVLFAMI